LGLVGGIASGKSTAAARLEELGAAVVNADKLGHEAYAVGTACFNKVVEHFGSDIVAEDGSINRRALGQIVFGDPAKMRELEAIVWPEIEKAVLSKIEELRASGSVSVVVVEAAIMLKAGWDKHVDEVWCAMVEPEVACERLMARNKLTKEEAMKRIGAQMSNEEHAARATVLLQNNSTVEDFVEAVDAAWKELQGRL